MTTTPQDLDEAGDVRIEWGCLVHYADRPDGMWAPITEEGARFNIDTVRAQINHVDPDRRGSVVGATGADLVSRTVTEYANGHRLIGPWEVAK